MKKYFMSLLVFGVVLTIPLICQAFEQWPDTGQTQCYDHEGNQISCPSSGEYNYAQDAQYQGIARSYTKLDDQGGDLPDTATSWAMVRDNVTGLIWEVKTVDGSIKTTECLSSDVETIFNWAEDNFPRFFPPPGALTQCFEPWLYRYYPSTDIYVGVNISCEVWVLGDVFGGLVYISTVQELLDTITPPPAPIPDILGTYSGSLAATTTECSEGGDDAFTLTGGITITSHQVGEAFKASGELMVERFGVLFRLNIDFSGSATSAGILNGRYTYAFSGENGFYSNGSGTFTGSVSGNTLTIQLSGLDTDIFGETCVVNGTFTGMLY